MLGYVRIKVLIFVPKSWQRPVVSVKNPACGFCAGHVCRVAMAIAWRGEGEVFVDGGC